MPRMADEIPSPTSPEATAPPEKVVRGGDIVAMILGGVVYLVVAGCGVLQILAALKIWSPLHWEGRLWTGIFMVAAPTALAVMSALPHRLRNKIDENVLAVTIIALWIGFFWAACGGH